MYLEEEEEGVWKCIIREGKEGGMSEWVKCVRWRKRWWVEGKMEEEEEEGEEQKKKKKEEMEEEEVQ